MFRRFGIDAEHPTYAYELTLWLVQFIGGLYVLSPWFQPETNPLVVLALGTLIAIKVYGFVLAAIGAAGLWYMWSDTSPRRYKVRRVCAFATSLIFLFFMLLRIITEGIGRLSWTTFLLAAVGAAVVYFRIKLEHPE